MKVRYSLVYNRRNKKLSSTSKAPVQIEIYFDRSTRRWVDTHVELEPQYWDDKAKNVSKKHPNFAGLYQLLKKQQDDLEAYELELLSQGRELTPDLLNAYFAGNKDDFIKFAINLIDEELLRKKIDKKSHIKYTSNLELLKKIAGEELLFSQVNENLVKEIDIYLNTHNYEQSTIGRFHVTVKKFTAAALKKEYIKKDPYEDFKIDRGESERVNLEPSELVMLENLDRQLLSDELIQVLDRFLFSCYTGLRIGDSILLQKEHIKNTPDSLIIDITTEKGKGQRIILHLAHLFDGKPQRIAQDYMERYPKIKTLFPPMTEQAVNRILKALAYMAGIKKTLTFHMARHTCGTALADLTANPYLIMDILGHKDIKTSMIYIHSSGERIRKQLLNVNWKW
ncbi:MAG: site-specific integrase [Prevotellaceae bacterium]|jgi:integrase|nr:site-specific integrase [Prevotellaceae bacterium]